MVLSQDNAARLEPTGGTSFSAPLRHPRRSSRSESARMRIRKRAGSDPRDTCAILHSGRVNDDVQQQAERVDQDMPFAAGDLLGRIKALRVKRGAPF